MPDYYVDPELGSNANSGLSALSPVLDWNAAAIGSGTFAPGDRLLFRGGSTYNAAVKGRIAPAFSASPTAAAPFVLSTYGSTARCIVECGGTRDVGIRPVASIDQANGPRYVTVSNFEVRNFTLHGVSIAEVLDTGVTDAFNTVTNCYVHDGGSSTTAAINIYGQGVTVSRNVVDRVNGDGILLRGRGYCGFNTVTRVGFLGSTEADAIQFDGGFSNSTIEGNVIDKDTTSKQALLFVGSSSQIRFNTIRGAVDVEGSGLVTINTGSNNFIFGNLIIGNDGLSILDATGVQYAYGNVIVGLNPRGTRQRSCGIDVGTTFTNVHEIYNNYVRGFHTGIFARNCNVRNNAVTGCSAFGIDTSVGAANESFNYCWNNFDNFSATPGTGSSEADQSQFYRDDGTLVVPLGTTAATIASLCPPAVAGTYIRALSLMNGRLRNGFVPIGAYQGVLPNAMR